MSYYARADGNHTAIADALRDVLRWPFRDLLRAGFGVEDFLVAVPAKTRFWVLVEAKVPVNKRGTVKPSQYTKAQREWRELTEGWPRITVVSAEDAVRQLRALAEA